MGELSEYYHDYADVKQGAVSFRYPGESADREDAEESFRIAIGLRTRLLEAIKGPHQRQ